MSTDEGKERREAGRSEPRGIAAPAAMHQASAQLGHMLRREPGLVSALRQTGDGWSADVEVVEIERIPDTTSVMASYRVQLDHEGRLLGYERTRRYARGQVDR
ncbi:gas vesicle protein [Streptomyces sp. NPDC101227]|uniref:gas vesicle protein GvpO n=1 Tax=Streptomyces sp. NPDC101227 TaxID=3366136 RepID=UPI00380B41E3